MVSVPVPRKKLPRPIFVILLVVFIGLAGLAVSRFGVCGKVRAAVACPALQPQSLDVSAELAPNYYQYSSENVQTAQASSNKVVLYFWAPWCSTCTSLDLELQEKNTTVPDGITVLRINYDDASDLRNRYNVVTQHTFVQIDDQGQPLALWVGGEIENFNKFLK